MRLAPAAIRHHHDRARAIDVARRQSATTHAALAAVDACAFFAGLLVDAINGADCSTLLSPQAFDGQREIAAIAAGSYMGKTRAEVASSGYVVDTLEAALWCLLKTESYEECVLKAVNLGNDTDTVAAVAGGLAGILYGSGSIPSRWLKQIPKLDYIKSLCEKLEDALEKMSTQKLIAFIPTTD